MVGRRRMVGTRPPSPCAVGCPLSAVRCPLSAVRCLLSAVCCQLHTGRCPLSAFRCLLAAVNCSLTAVRNNSIPQGQPLQEDLEEPEDTVEIQLLQNAPNNDASSEEDDGKELGSPTEPTTEPK